LRRRSDCCPGRSARPTPETARNSVEVTAKRKRAIPRHAAETSLAKTLELAKRISLEQKVGATPCSTPGASHFNEAGMLTKPPNALDDEADCEKYGVRSERNSLD
jgi:hypothetical protein